MAIQHRTIRGPGPHLQNTAGKGGLELLLNDKAKEGWELVEQQAAFDGNGRLYIFRQEVSPRSPIDPKCGSGGSRSLGPNLNGGPSSCSGSWPTKEHSCSASYPNCWWPGIVASGRMGLNRANVFTRRRLFDSVDLPDIRGTYSARPSAVEVWTSLWGPRTG